MSKLSLVNEVGIIDGTAEPKENPYEVKIPQVEIPRKVCSNHQVAYALMGEPCPNCKRLSLFAYEY